MSILKGKLTYLVSVAGLIWGVYQIFTGDVEQGLVTIGAGLGLFGVRRAIGS